MQEEDIKQTHSAPPPVDQEEQKPASREDFGPPPIDDNEDGVRWIV